MREVGFDFVTGTASAACPDRTQKLHAGADYDYYVLWGDSLDIAEAMTYNYVAWASNNIYEKPLSENGVCTQIQIKTYWIHAWSGEVLNQPPATNRCEDTNGDGIPDHCDLIDVYWDHVTTTHSGSDFHVTNLFTGKDPNDDLGHDGNYCLDGMARSIVDWVSFTSMQACVPSWVQPKSDFEGEILLAHELGHLYGGLHSDAENVGWDWGCWCEKWTVMGTNFLMHRVEWFSNANRDTIRAYIVARPCYDNGGTGC